MMQPENVSIKLLECLDDHIRDDNEFLKKLKAVKSDMPTVAIIEPNNPQQEIEARMLGVSAVIPEDCDGQYFCEVMASVLGLHSANLVGTIYAVKET